MPTTPMATGQIQQDCTCEPAATFLPLHALVNSYCLALDAPIGSDHCRRLSRHAIPITRLARRGLRRWTGNWALVQCLASDRQHGQSPGTPHNCRPQDGCSQTYSQGQLLLGLGGRNDRFRGRLTGRGLEGRRDVVDARHEFLDQFGPLLRTQDRRSLERHPIAELHLELVAY